MFDIPQILSAFTGLVGWRQNNNPKGVQLDGITTSSSGLWFNKQHPLITIENLHSVAPDFSEWYDAWVSGTSYATNAIVAYGGKYYKSAVPANLGNTPGVDANWDEYFAFSEWLETITNDYIIAVFNDWIHEKSMMKTANNLLSSDTLFNYSGSKVLTDKTSSRVGLVINTYPSESLKIRVRELGVQLSVNQSLDIYLYQIGYNTAIETVNVTYTGSGSVQWFTVDWEINGDETYYLVYDEDDLTGSAINGIEGGFGSASRIGMIPFHSFIKYSPGMTKEAIGTIWDIDTFGLTYDTNYGLNMKFDIRCDYTQFLIDQKMLFKTLIAKGVAVRFMRELVFNPSSNINRSSSNINIQRIDIMNELDGDTSEPKSVGLLQEYNEAMASIQMDVSGIDKLCLPCSKRSVRYRSVV